MEQQAELFICAECGENYPECICPGYRNDERLARSYGEWISNRIGSTATSGLSMPGYSFLFATLTFGCTRCAGGYSDPRHGSDHEYLKPGPQMGRRRYKEFWDKINGELISHNSYVDVVYGAEEKGTYGGRLHYHSVVRLYGDLPDNILVVMDDHWKSGFTKFRWLTETGRAIAYVSKYTSKAHRGAGEATPFFYFEYAPKSLSEVSHVV